MTVEVHCCQSCGTFLPRAALQATHPEGDGRPIWVCLDREGCARRNAANVQKLNQTPTEGV